MRVTITTDGTVIIDAETSVEAYALNKWIADNRDKIEMGKVPMLFGLDYDNDDS